MSTVGDCDILHMHWPEAYFPNKGDHFDWFRSARFPVDLARGTRNCRLVMTAHNFHIHNREQEPFVERAVKYAYRKASVTFAHSAAAKRQLVEAFGLIPERIRVISHGDLSVELGPPLPKCTARKRLNLRSETVALMFGTVEPYKGLEEVISWWQMARPKATLAIVGRPTTAAYGAKILHRIGDASNIRYHPNWLSQDDLRLWLSAADVVVFNYREIFTSGAASLARSFGIPLLIPRRLTTIALDEPSPYVQRFTSLETDFAEALSAATAVKPDFAAATTWREACSWDDVARVTLDGYVSAIG